MDKNKMILDAFKFRYACKKFDPKKTVSKEDFDTILQVANLSPSSFGFEPWKFLVVEDKQIKEELAPVAWGAQNSFKGASHFVILLARKKIDTIYSSNYVDNIMNQIQKLPKDVAKGKKEAFEYFQKNDFKLLDNDRAIFDWASKQTYIVLGNMLTAAALLGIDSCPIEGFDKNEVQKILGSKNIYDKEHFEVSVMVSFGYRDETPYPKTRQALEEVVKYV